jgi:hypothetical protein
LDECGPSFGARGRPALHDWSANLHVVLLLSLRKVTAQTPMFTRTHYLAYPRSGFSFLAPSPAPGHFFALIPIFPLIIRDEIVRREISSNANAQLFLALCKLSFVAFGRRATKRNPISTRIRVNEQLAGQHLHTGAHRGSSHRSNNSLRSTTEPTVLRQQTTSMVAKLPAYTGQCVSVASGQVRVHRRWRRRRGWNGLPPGDSPIPGRKNKVFN